MSYQTAALLVDPAGRVMPQWYDEGADRWWPTSTSHPQPGSGGGGMSIEDLLFTDDTGVSFIFRDSGATPPVFTAYLIPAGSAYTVGANPRPYAVKSVTVGNTTAAPANVQVASLYYPSSTGNNTSAQLAAGATFTGAIETVLSLQAAQIEVVCDQAYTLVVSQYIDAAGTQLSGSRTFVRAAGVPMNINLLLPGNYFRLALTNNGGSTTTTLAINTTFGIMDSVDDTGRMMVNTPQAAPYTGQQLVTSSAVALPSRALLNGVVVTAYSGNSGSVVVGPTGLTAAVDGTGNGEILQPGVARAFAAENANQLLLRLATGNASTTDFVTFSGN